MADTRSNSAIKKKGKSFMALLAVVRKYSTKQLAIFAILSGAIGSYLVWQSLAATPALATIQAEQMTLPPGASIITDSTASGGQAIKLISNGTATSSVTLPSTANAATVTARSSQCNGWASMSLNIDGTTVLPSTGISSSSWAGYKNTAVVNLGSGSHKISIIGSNLGKSHGCYRTLYLDVTALDGPAATPATAPVPTVALSASPASLTAGASSTLTWTSTNATGCTASGAWSGAQPTSGTASTGALNTSSSYNLSCTGAGGGAASGSAVVSVSSVTPTSSTMGQMFITTAELNAKPMSGAGWTFLKSKADLASYGTVNLADQNSLTSSYVLAGALVYARTGDITYKNKVITHLKQVCGTEVATTTQLLALARTLYGYVVSADMVQMPYSTTCNNGETWQAFLARIRTTIIPGNSRWPTLEKTSIDTSSNWGAFALSSHLAVSYALNDTVAIQRDIDIFKRVLGDTTSPAPAFNPTAGYNFNSNGATWDMTATMQRGINPASSTDPRAGALIEDALRLTSGGADSTPCCTVQPSGVTYQEESLDGIFSTAQLLRAHGADMTTSQDGAMKRAFDFYMKNGGPGPYTLTRYLSFATNYWYGTAYVTQTEDRPFRHMGYGSWLFTKP